VASHSHGEIFSKPPNDDKTLNGVWEFQLSFMLGSSLEYEMEQGKRTGLREI